MKTERIEQEFRDVSNFGLNVHRFASGRIGFDWKEMVKQPSCTIVDHFLFTPQEARRLGAFLLEIATDVESSNGDKETI